MLVVLQTEVSESHPSHGMHDVPARELVLARLLYKPETLLRMQLLFQDFRSETEVQGVLRCLQDYVATEWKAVKAEMGCTRGSSLSVLS